MAESGQYRATGSIPMQVEFGTHFYLYTLLRCSQRDDVIAVTSDYDGEFTAKICTIVCTQFHPEKSQTAGIHVLKNFGSL